MQCRSSGHALKAFQKTARKFPIWQSEGCLSWIDKAANLWLNTGYINMNTKLVCAMVYTGYFAWSFICLAQVEHSWCVRRKKSFAEDSLFKVVEIRARVVTREVLKSRCNCLHNASQGCPAWRDLHSIDLSLGWLARSSFWGGCKIKFVLVNISLGPYLIALHQGSSSHRHSRTQDPSAGRKNEALNWNGAFLGVNDCLW